MMGILAPPDARPDFLMRLDTGVNTALQVTASTPRTFLGAADHDPQVADNTGRFYAALHAARVPAELADYVATEKLSSIKITYLRVRPPGHQPHTLSGWNCFGYN